MAVIFACGKKSFVKHGYKPAQDRIGRLVSAVRQVVQFTPEAVAALPDLTKLCKVYGRVHGLTKFGYLVSLALAPYWCILS